MEHISLRINVFSFTQVSINPRKRRHCTEWTCLLRLSQQSPCGFLFCKMNTLFLYCMTHTVYGSNAHIVFFQIFIHSKSLREPTISFSGAGVPRVVVSYVNYRQLAVVQIGLSFRLLGRIIILSYFQKLLQK